MKYLSQAFILALLSFFFATQAFAVTYNNSDTSSYTTLRTIDLGTYNEYRYKLTEQFFEMREYFEVNNKLERGTLQNIAVIANTGYKYLPDNLQNQNLLRELLIDIQKWVKTPENTILYTEIVQSLADYLEQVEIEWITWSVEVSPQSGNAPLTVTFRGGVTDPSGTQILPSNYTWWVDSAGKKVVIGRGPSINYTFRDEGIYTVFLDVTSSHKNNEWYTDVLPYRGRVDITAQEKVASLIINVDGDRIEDNEVLKFTPDDANYGLLFDASSSTPTGGAQFVRTIWDFWNGATRSYNGPPKIERVRYGTEGDYSVRLRLETNEWKIVERNFALIIRDPIARIEANRDDGFIGDSFTFSAKSSGLERNLRYTWEIIDIENDTVITQKSDRVLTHVFTKKWKYNVRLNVRQSSGEVDQDSYIVYVTSQAPIAEFNSRIPLTNKPNQVLLDASRSYDPDFSDDGNLKYDWFINGERVALADTNAKGSIGYYTFDSIGTHTINLEVTDPDGIVDIKKWNITINSILSVEMQASPRVIQRGEFIKFDVEAPEAEVFEWDFWDGKKSGGSFDTITHFYEKSGTFNVRVTVTDKDNVRNSYLQSVYVWDSESPLALVSVNYGTLETPVFDEAACDGVGAYVVDRVNALRLDANESINVDGLNSGLEYSWKIGQKFSSSVNVNHKFDEIGCFPAKLTVKSRSNGKTDSEEIMMEVRNLEPTLSAVSVNIENPDEDPLIVRVAAQGAKDPDGVIQSYLWYYYTDIDPEPQDFRSTATASTAFVIPKVTGNYYFVAILKDNNEARVTSEEITGSRYFTTITGDNINTPIVELSANDTSTIIGEEITFTAKAQNILGQSVEKDASFSWDFDGDGFYDTQTSEPTTTHVYRKSGEFYAKVKVKYRGISSTKNITMNVGNKLVPDFGYISVGNTFIFFDNSTGQIDARSWDLWDGTKKSGTNFTHTYTDKVTSHTVTLKISEWTKVKEVQKKVTKNIKNILKSKGKSFVGFSFPETDGSGNITLESPSETVFIYMGEWGDENTLYAIDYDIENDSDLNGGMDDDEDNAGTASYTSGDITEIPLNAFKTQTIRLFTKSQSGEILGSQDITIIKEYIEESNIDPNTIIFEGASESEKQKIETLKSFLSNLPQQQRLESLSYVQKLQENWSDNTEKTRTILDFENYIFELGLEDENEIIALLESLLVEWQEDQSAKQITYTALVNLIPQDISCEVPSWTCYDSLLSKLEDIRSSDDVEYNKTLGWEILEVVGTTDLMTNAQKLDFKAILTSLVYGGDVESIPEEEKQEVIDQEIPVEELEETQNSWILWVFLTILKWLWILLWVFLFIVLLLYIFYLIFGRKKSTGFSNYISSITSFKKKNENGETQSISESDDILGDFEEDISEKQSDILSSMDAKPEEKIKKEEVLKDVVEANTPVGDDILAPNWGAEDVPDWLKGNFETDEKKEVTDTQTTTQPWIPPLPEDKWEKEWSDYLEVRAKQKGAAEKMSVVGNKDIRSGKIEEPQIDIEAETKIEEENIPDWLKWAADFSKTPEKIETPEEINTIENNISEIWEKKIQDKIPETEESSSLTQETSPEVSPEKTPVKEAVLSDDNVPDWLKWSFDTPKEEVKKPEEVQDVMQDKTSEKNLDGVSKKQPEKKSVKQEEGNSKSKKSEKPEKPEKQKVSLKQDNAPKQKNQETPLEQAQEKIQEIPKIEAQGIKWNKAQETSQKAVKEKKVDEVKTPKTTKETSPKKDGNELWDDGMKIPDWLKTDD